MPVAEGFRTWVQFPPPPPIQPGRTALRSLEKIEDLEGGLGLAILSGASVNHVRENLDDARLADLHRQAKTPLESERSRESNGQRFQETGHGHDETKGVLPEEAQVARGRVGYVGDVAAVDVEDHERQVVRTSLLGDHRAEEDPR